MASKYNAVYISYINDIHILMNDVVRNGIGTVSFGEIADVGNRDKAGYKATMTFNALSKVGGNDPAHLVPLARLVQHHIRTYFPHLAYEYLVLKMDDNCDAMLLSTELNEYIKANMKGVSDDQLFATSDAAYIPAIA